MSAPVVGECVRQRIAGGVDEWHPGSSLRIGIPSFSHPGADLQDTAAGPQSTHGEQSLDVPPAGLSSRSRLWEPNLASQLGKQGIPAQRVPPWGVQMDEQAGSLLERRRHRFPPE